MPASSSSLTKDEFAALVAAALGDMDVGGNVDVGGNSRINCIDGQGRLQISPTINASVKHPFLSWHSQKQKLEQSTSSSRFCESFVDFPHKRIEFRDAEVATTSLSNYLTKPYKKSLTTGMTTCIAEPTVLSSMSIVDLGNCLGLGGCGSGSCAGTSSISNNSASLVSGKKMGGTVSTANATSKIPIFTLEVGGEAGDSGRPVDLASSAIDLSSTLRLPRTPLFRKSAPDLRIHDPPRSQYQQPYSSRTPRKSFFSKLREQLSSKTSLNSHSSQDPPIMSTPLPPTFVSHSSNAHTDGSPTGLFKLHLSLPLSPLSLSTSESPSPSRSPSPRFPSRSVSASHIRESAPPVNIVVEKPPSPHDNMSPNSTWSDRPVLHSGDKGTRRIHSLDDYNYSHAHSDQDFCATRLVRLVENNLLGQLPELDAQLTGSNSILSLSDCLVGDSGKMTAQIDWEPKRRRSKKTKSSGKEGAKVDSGPRPQPFPTLTQPDSDGILSDPSKYSCESAPRSVRTSMEKNETSTANGVVFLRQPELQTETSCLIHSSSSLTSPNHSDPEPEEEFLAYAPFVPLVFQHERLQQKLQKSVPLASFEGAPEEDACIKSVPLRPFPLRASSLSSAASICVQQRTKSASNAGHEEKPSNFKPPSAIPPIPIFPTSVPTSIKSQPGSASQTLLVASKKDREVQRPTTAPANSSSLKTQAAGKIPFPVAKKNEAELVGEENVDSERHINSSKPQGLKLRKSPPLPLRSSVSSPAVGPPSSLQSTPNTTDHSNSHREGVSGSRTGSVGLNYSLSLSQHPYAQARASEGVSSSPESEAKGEARKTSITFVPSTGGDSNRLHFQTKARRHLKVPPNLIPPSPTSNSGSGSGSEASTKSPVTPRSPSFWTIGGSGGIAAAVKSKVGLGIAGSTPTSASETEGHNFFEHKAYREAIVASDSMSGCVVRNSDEVGRMNKSYKPRHPYSRSYSTNHSSDEENTATAASPSKENPQNLIDSQTPLTRSTVNASDGPSSASSISRRPSMQMLMHEIVPSKPPPVGPLPCPPDARGGSDGYKVGENVFSEVLPSPVPSEYAKAFSNSSNHVRVQDDGDSFSNLPDAPSNASSQSSESYEHDPEYEALLAANTRANVGELFSMRNIGVGRRLMSGYPQPPSSHIDSTSLTTEGKRKRVHSEATRKPGMIGEWTLFLGNDDTPPRRAADLSAVPMTGRKSLRGVRARTKSESALHALELRHKKSCGMNLASGSSNHTPSPQPPVPNLMKKKMLESEDWTLSLPLLPPEEGDSIKLKTTVEVDLSRTRRLSDPLSRGVKSPPRYPGPEICVEGVVVDNEINLDDTDDMAAAESQSVDTPFWLNIIDNLDVEDEEDSLLDFSENSETDALPTNRLLLSVPRLVSKGSGIECATWGEELDEVIIKNKARRLSDGLDGVLGMTGMNVRVGVNEDGESVCVVDGLSLNTEEVADGSEEGLTNDGHKSPDLDASDAMKENLSRLDALSADLKRFNELLKEGVGATHARSCGLGSSQKEAKTDHPRVQQSLDALQDVNGGSGSTNSALGVSVKDRIKAWTERSVLANGPPSVPPSVSPRQSSPPTSPIAMRSRVPLPFAPLSPPNARPLGIGPTAMLPGSGRSATGRAITIVTKPSHLKIVPAIGATIPDGVVGSGLKVGGNGRVISLSCSSAAAPVIASTQAGLLSVITNETKEKKPAAIVVEGKDGEKTGTDPVPAKDPKRDSASSYVSTDSFFTSFTSPTPPPNKDATGFELRQDSSSDCGSDSATPTATSLPGLRIITTSTANSTRAHSPVDDVYTPSSSAMPTPLASSFPNVPPLPAGLGEDFKTISRILSATWMSQNQAGREADEPLERHGRSTYSEASRLSCASDMSARTIVPEHHTRQELPVDTPLHSGWEAGHDAESVYSDSFYSARSSFEA